jgi:hypothetical protein
VAEDFEKDDDANHHMDFITATSNLRATNYDIRVGADKMATKQIAGRIIPAVATTTAMTTGGDVLELINYLQGHRHINLYRKWYFDLDLNVLNTWAPNGCAVRPSTPNRDMIAVPNMLLGRLVPTFVGYRARVVYDALVLEGKGEAEVACLTIVGRIATMTTAAFLVSVVAGPGGEGEARRMNGWV